jgi:glutamyl-tRNA synthetase
MKTTARTSRLAPSPTGALHLGNARTFLVNWAMARREGWELQMRMEDLDGPRIKKNAAKQTLDIMEWLGMDFDGACRVQSDDVDPYRRAMHHLAARGLVYPCRLSRTEIAAAATAPHDGQEELRFPSTLRPETGACAFGAEDANYRLIVADEDVAFTDEFAGPCSYRPAAECGDFVVWTRRGTPAYQLAVVVDDARSGVTDVVRGDDLLASTARQLLLYRALAAAPPRWWHLPLVRGADGRRLAKRHGDTRIASYRDRGVTAPRIVGLLAHWSGVTDERREMDAAGFREQFSIDALPGRPIIFSEDDDQWLKHGCS